jgi:transposase
MLGRNADHGGWPMSVPRVRPVRLTATQRHRLKKIARGHKRPHRDRLRALIVLGAAGGRAGAAIARRCRVTPDTARKWRGRFATDALDGLRDRKRCAAPVHPVQQAQAKALACELPATSGIPLSRWSAAEVADEAVTAGLVDPISGATVPRWLRADALKPWQYRSWVTLWAPDFAARAAVALDPLRRKLRPRAAGRRQPVKHQVRHHRGAEPGAPAP